MSKPSLQELECALEKAKHMRETGEDPDFIAKSLLNCHYQFTYLEQVLHAAQHYVNSGLGEREHSRLIQVLIRHVKLMNAALNKAIRSLG